MSFGASFVSFLVSKLFVSTFAFQYSDCSNILTKFRCITLRSEDFNKAHICISCVAGVAGLLDDDVMN